MTICTHHTHLRKKGSKQCKIGVLQDDMVLNRAVTTCEEHLKNHLFLECTIYVVVMLRDGNDQLVMTVSQNFATC